MKPGQVIGSYRIVRLLGEGGMGAVYEAIHETIERRVALKVLHAQLAHDREAMSRFFNETVEKNHRRKISRFSKLGNGLGRATRQRRSPCASPWAGPMRRQICVLGSNPLG